MEIFPLGIITIVVTRQFGPMILNPITVFRTFFEAVCENGIPHWIKVTDIIIDDFTFWKTFHCYGHASR